MKRVLGIFLAASLGVGLLPSVIVHATEPVDTQTGSTTERVYETAEDEGGSAVDEDDSKNEDASGEEGTSKEETASGEESASGEGSASENGSSVVIDGSEETPGASDEESEGSKDASEDVGASENASEAGESSDEQEQGYTITFDSFEGGKIVAYDRKDFEGAVVYDDATTIVARDGDTGEVDTTGDGQANFTVVLEDGYALENIAVTEGEGNYKNFKTISEEGNVYTYRITKITGNIRVAVETKLLSSEDNRALLVEEFNEVIKSYPVYYRFYCTEETASALTEALEAAKAIDVETASDEDIQQAINDVKEAVTALVYKTAEVPQIYVSTKNGNGNFLKKSTGYVETSIVIADGESTFTDEGASIKVRGNSTAEGEKKPFNVKLSSKQDVLGMGSAKKWCLLANCFDASLMRNATALAIAKEMGLPYTSENKFVELWIDGVFKGCYLLTEAVEAGKSRVDINVKGDDFMLELEKSRVEAGTTYIKNANGIRFSFKEPEEPSEEKLASVQATLDRITAIIDSGDYEAVKEVIDIDSFAKFYVLNEYMRNGDFNFSSVYFFYKDGVLYAGPAWDFDLSSGNVKDETHAKTEHAHASRCNWYPYLLKYSEFQKEIEDTFAKYSDYLESITADGGFIDTTYANNKAVFDRNFGKAGWVASKRYSINQMVPLATYEDNLYYFKNWLTNRMAWIKKYYASLTPNVWVYPTEGGEDYIKISWREEEGVDGYRVYRYEGDNRAPITGLIQGNTYFDYTVEAGVDYRYDVVSVVNGQQGTRDYVGVPGSISSKTEVEFVFSKQPSDVYVKNSGDYAVFSVEATGKDLKYMWYVKTPDSDRFVKSGVDTPEYRKKMNAKNDGLQAYCIISDAYGHKVKTDIVTASFVHNFEITKDTEDQLITRVGSKCTFTIEAVGEGLSYSWYYKMPDGDGKFHKAGCYTNEYTRTASEKKDGLQVYCVVTDANGIKKQGRTATLTLDKAQMEISYPNGKILEVESGKKAVFKVETTAEGASYCWYYMIPESAGGDGQFHKAGNYTSEYSRTCSYKKDGMQAYCIITDSLGRKMTSDTMTLIMK